MVGTTISHYKVLEKIGQGGMGEVYRAEDTNLSREVAIKVLPEQFTQDPQRLARFEREAKLLASLNHPNIAAIYGYEEADDIHFLVLELVEGKTLAERVKKGPLPVEEALEVCRQFLGQLQAFRKESFKMRNRIIGSILAAVVLAISPLLLAQTAQQSGAAKATPDLSGVWTKDGDAGYGQTFKRNEAPPMQPWAVEIFKVVRGDPSSRKGRDDMDPYVSCAPRGIPRVLLSSRPIEIVQTPGRVLMLLEADHTFRQIYTDGRELPEDPDPMWMGHSVGRWDGDTLVVDTIGLQGNGLTWLDSLGHPHTDALHIVERIRRVDHDTLEIDFTFDDPKAYKKPWTGKLGYRLRPDMEVTEMIPCESHLINEHLQNKDRWENYFLGGTPETGTKQ